MAKLGKVIQVTAVPSSEEDHPVLYALTEDGRMYATSMLCNWEDAEWTEVGKTIKE